MKLWAKILCVILGIMMICSGIYCIMTPAMSYLMVGLMVGMTMMFDAGGRFVAWWDIKQNGESDFWLFLSAVLSMVLGIILLCDSQLMLGVDVFIFVFIAVWLLCDGIHILYKSLQLHKLHKNWNTNYLGSRWYIPFILGILLVVFGVLCLLNPNVMASAIGIIIGLAIISSGCSVISLSTMKTE